MTTVAQTRGENQIPRVDEALEHLLQEGAENLARQTGFVQRRSAITGAVFAQTLLFGWLAHPDASYTQLQQMMALLGVDASASALEQRMSPSAADFLLQLLSEMAGECVNGQECLLPILQRFNGVYLQDGTIINLPESLSDIWRGSGGNSPHSNQAGLRVQVRLNLSTGGLSNLCVEHARGSERTQPGDLGYEPLPSGALWVIDTGYFALRGMREMQEGGQHWITHARADLLVRDSRGVRYPSMPAFLASRQGKGVVDEWVTLGSREQVRSRVVAFEMSEEATARRQGRVNRATQVRGRGCRRDVRVGKKHQRPSIDGTKRYRPGKLRQQMMNWTALLTSVPVEQLSAPEARIVMRARWQIELLWRLWKERGQVDIWRSEKPMRILCEMYAKLMGMIVQHWLTIQGCWEQPHRSLVKASMAVQLLAPTFALALGGLVPMQSLLAVSRRMMKRASLNSRRKKPSTSQLLTEPACWKEGFT